MNRRRRVVVLRNPGKREAEATMASLVSRLSQSADVVATGVIDDAESLATSEPDRMIVLGGDGSILAVARALGEHEIPIVGVNFGKLGFLAEFSVGELDRHLDVVLNDASIVSRRMMIEVVVRLGQRRSCSCVAANDCVVQAGPPFRVVELAIALDGYPLTTVSGDGVVLATPTGSTAHNMSVGGPIVQPGTPAIVLSPINPHSLSHRPLVVMAESTIEVTACRVNSGTAVVIDGQVSIPIVDGDAVTVGRCPHDFQLVQNPCNGKWNTLITKLKWGQ